MAKGATGATNHYWMQKDKWILKHTTKIDGPSVQLPDGQVISTSHKGELPLPSCLSSKAKTTMILPKLKSSNLISLGQLCDDGCSIILNEKEMLATKNNAVVLKGYRNRSDGLWDIPIHKYGITSKCIPSPPTHAGMYKGKTQHAHSLQSNTLLLPKCTKLPKHLKKFR